MAYPVLNWHKLLRGSLLRRVVLRAFMLVLALIAVFLVKMDRDFNVIEHIVPNFDKCPLNLGWNADVKPSGFMNSALSFGLTFSEASHKKRESLTKVVFTELMEMNLLQSNARALCVGEGSASAMLSLRELGLFNAFVVESHPFFSLLKMRFVYELEFEDNLFDLVFSGEIDRVSVPSLLVMEIERVLRPGGTGIILVKTRKFYSGGLISSFLKRSDIVHACGIGSFTIVIFEKRLNSFASFENFQLPNNCPSVSKNQPFMKYLEPLLHKTEPSYLPNYMNISSINKLVYINIGAGEFAKKNMAKMMDPYLSNHHKAFDVFVIDHKTSVLTSLLTDPGITFIYDPSLSGSPVSQDIGPDDYLSDVMEEEVFEFVPWFNETVNDGDFVVIVMKAKVVELNILVEMFQTGAICSVDELFVKCSGDSGCKNLLESLRKSGVYVHEWSGD